MHSPREVVTNETPRVMKKRSPDFYHFFVGGKEKNVKIFSRSLVKGVDLNFAL